MTESLQLIFRRSFREVRRKPFQNDRFHPWEASFHPSTCANDWARNDAGQRDAKAFVSVSTNYLGSRNGCATRSIGYSSFIAVRRDEQDELR